MNERDLETRLRDAFRAEAARVDPGALIERVHAIPTTAGPARPRWWQRLRSGAPRSAGFGGVQVRGASDMFAASAVTAAIAALVLGGVFMGAQVREVSEPLGSAVTPTGEPWVIVTGTQSLSGGGPAGLYGRRLNVSDPRLEGDVTITYEEHDSTGHIATLWSTVTITNTGGSWDGQSIGFIDDRGAHRHMGWFEGTGEYDGLSYIEQLSEGEVNTAGTWLDVVGLVYEGNLPPMVLPAEAMD